MITQSLHGMIKTTTNLEMVICQQYDIKIKACTSFINVQNLSSYSKIASALKIPIEYTHRNWPACDSKPPFKLLPLPSLKKDPCIRSVTYDKYAIYTTIAKHTLYYCCKCF
jgi:hypothetical protein